MTGQAFAQAMAALEVNGPEDRPRKPEAPAGWDRIDWRAQEGRVRRLRQRIFKAAQEQDWAKVRNLQKLTAAEPVEHAGQRAAGDAAQCRAQNPGDRRGGRVDFRSQGGYRGASAPVGFVVAAPRGQARVHTESR